jgi:DNA-binding HxlR family transcriptional regulator
MSQKRSPSVFDEACSARHTLEVISGKWPILIISALAAGPMRNGELIRQIGGISQKMLTQALRRLEFNGLVIRCDHGTNPLHVDYRLSELGRSLSEALSALDRWAEENFCRLDIARADYLDRQRQRREDGRWSPGLPLGRHGAE